MPGQPSARVTGGVVTQLQCGAGGGRVDGCTIAPPEHASMQKHVPCGYEHAIARGIAHGPGVLNCGGHVRSAASATTVASGALAFASRGGRGAGLFGGDDVQHPRTP